MRTLGFWTIVILDHFISEAVSGTPFAQPGTVLLLLLLTGLLAFLDWLEVMGRYPHE